MQRISLWLKKYFIPHEGNEYKPHFLRHEAMLFFFFLVIIVELGFLIQVFLIFDKTKFLASVLPGVLATLTNEERALNDAPPLVENDLLKAAAQMKAEDMATRGYFAHTSPDGKTPWYWLNQVGYRFLAAGENLAVNFFESDDVGRAWMNSPTHRANIVKKDFTEIGIGVADGVYEGRHTVFVAQFFGTPLKIIPLENTASTQASTTTPESPKPEAVAVNTQTTPVSPAPEPIEIKVLGEETKFIDKVLTSPRQSLTYAYMGIALLVLLALMLAVFIRSEIQHPKIIFRGLALVAVIIALSFVNLQVLNLDTKVPIDISANVIEVFSIIE